MRTPWRTLGPLEPGEQYLAVATLLRPHRRRSAFPLFAGVRRAGRQAVDAGALGFATEARPLARRYRTISVWAGEEDLARFAGSGAHGRLVAELGPSLECVSTARWWIEGPSTPEWHDADRHLGDADVSG